MTYQLTEKKWLRKLPVSFTSNGTTDGIVTISNSATYRVKMEVIIRSSTQQPVILEIKRVINNTQFYVGPINRPIIEYSDISNFLVADGANIEVPEQNRSKVPEEQVERITFEEDPINARRVFLVDEYGDQIDDNNPLPVTATISGAGDPQSRFGYRIAYPVANTETSFSIPANTKKLYVAVERKDAILRVSFVANGTDPSLANDFLTVEYGNSYWREGIKLVGKTMYYRANKGGIIVEIEAWV